MSGDEDQIVEALTQNIEQIKDEFTRELGKARLAEARSQQAQSLARAAEIKGQKPEAQARLAEAKSQKEQALAHLKRAEEVQPESAEVWDQLFQYYIRAQQWDALQPYLTKLTAANQDKAGGLLYQFRLAMAKAQPEEAVEIGRQLTIKLPEFAQSWLALAQGLQAARKFDEAREAYLRVLEKTPMNLEAYRGRD